MMLGNGLLFSELANLSHFGRNHVANKDFDQLLPIKSCLANSDLGFVLAHAFSSGKATLVNFNLP